MDTWWRHSGSSLRKGDWRSTEEDDSGANVTCYDHKETSSSCKSSSSFEHTCKARESTNLCKLTFGRNSWLRGWCVTVMLRKLVTDWPTKANPQLSNRICICRCGYLVQNAWIERLIDLIPQKDLRQLRVTRSSSGTVLSENWIWHVHFATWLSRMVPLEHKSTSKHTQRYSRRYCRGMTFKKHVNNTQSSDILRERLL